MLSLPVLIRSANSVFVGLFAAQGKPAINGLDGSSFENTIIPEPHVIGIIVGSPMLGLTMGILPSYSWILAGNRNVSGSITRLSIVDDDEFVILIVRFTRLPVVE